MAKRTKQPAQTGQDWSAPAAELLAELPADRDGLLAAAVAAVVEIDAAVMRGDGAAAEVAGDRYEAIIWKLNGGTNFGCMADDEAAGRVIERHCAAVPGEVPLWGQRGQFLAVTGDMRALVEYEAGYGGPLNAHFQFHAVDLDRPFISETGYRSRFSHERERAAAGYYEVMLDDYGIRAQLTATERVGLHKYTYPAGEDQHLVPAARLEQVTEQFLLLFSIGFDDALGHRLGRRVARRDIDRSRVVQQAAGQFADFRREGGREHQVLPLLGQQRDDLADVADEAHVEHAVGFVEDENLDGREVDRALLHVVEQTARRRD